MITRDEAIEACLRFEDSFEDYPFKDPNWTIMRHKSNNKMFAAIYEHCGRIWINIKAEPMTGDFWKKRFSCGGSGLSYEQGTLDKRNLGRKHDR